MLAARPIDTVLADASVDAQVAEHLRQLPAIRRFAVEELRLVDSRSYRKYVDLERDAVVWSVVATPADSLQPKQWCFPVVGCTSYRGYFSLDAAQAYAQSLADQGWDVSVDPVPAYSTLGWFDDPLPSTVIRWPLAEIAGLLFHELAHETLYVRDDSAFNEAYATLVEQEGIRRWLAAHGSETERFNHALRSRRRSDFLHLLGSTRRELEQLYASDLGAESLRRRKEEALTGLRHAYDLQKQAWGGYAGYDAWFERPLNNARFASIATYYELLSAFEALLRDVGGDMERFHTACRELAALREGERRARLVALAADQTQGQR
jgi:predicted aminopeptidase